MTSEHENNAPFPKPWGPQTGGWRGAHGGKTPTAILPWFAVTASHIAPNYLYHVGGGESKGEEKKGEVEEDRYHIPVRAWPEQSD